MISKLIEKIEKTGAPVCVGLDPNLSFVPDQIKSRAFGEKGENPEGAALAISLFNKGIVDAVYDLIPAVKPQIAMYEQFGIPGLIAFKETVDYCHEKGLLVIGDIKRGDIGNTSASYAKAHIGEIEIGSSSFKPFDINLTSELLYFNNSKTADFFKMHSKIIKKIIYLLDFNAQMSNNTYVNTSRSEMQWRINTFTQ